MLLLHKFSPKTVSWFRSYLNGRKQDVLVESRTSNPLDVGDQGVPQGSLLGHILFSIFYNDFMDVRDEGSSILYADDNTDTQAQNKIQKIANKSSLWVHDRKLVCSGAETKLIVMGTKELRRSRLTNQNKLIIATQSSNPAIDRLMISFVILSLMTDPD